MKKKEAKQSAAKHKESPPKKSTAPAAKAKPDPKKAKVSDKKVEGKIKKLTFKQRPAVEEEKQEMPSTEPADQEMEESQMVVHQDGTTYDVQLSKQNSQQRDSQINIQITGSPRNPGENSASIAVNEPLVAHATRSEGSSDSEVRARRPKEITKPAQPRPSKSISDNQLPQSSRSKSKQPPSRSDSKKNEGPVKQKTDRPPSKQKSIPPDKSGQAKSQVKSQVTTKSIKTQKSQMKSQKSQIKRNSVSQTPAKKPIALPKSPVSHTPINLPKSPISGSRKSIGFPRSPVAGAKTPKVGGSKSPLTKDRKTSFASPIIGRDQSPHKPQMTKTKSQLTNQASEKPPKRTKSRKDDGKESRKEPKKKKMEDRPSFISDQQQQPLETAAFYQPSLENSEDGAPVDRYISRREQSSSEERDNQSQHNEEDEEAHAYHFSPRKMTRAEEHSSEDEPRQSAPKRREQPTSPTMPVESDCHHRSERSDSEEEHSRQEHEPEHQEEAHEIDQDQQHAEEKEDSDDDEEAQQQPMIEALETHSDQQVQHRAHQENGHEHSENHEHEAHNHSDHHDHKVQGTTPSPDYNIHEIEPNFNSSHHPPTFDHTPQAQDRVASFHPPAPDSEEDNHSNQFIEDHYSEHPAENAFLPSQVPQDSLQEPQKRVQSSNPEQPNYSHEREIPDYHDLQEHHPVQPAAPLPTSDEDEPENTQEEETQRLISGNNKAYSEPIVEHTFSEVADRSKLQKFSDYSFLPVEQPAESIIEFDKFKVGGEEHPLSKEQILQVTRSWEKILSKGAEKVGMTLMKNWFNQSPSSLQVFPKLRNRQNLYRSKELILQSKQLLQLIGTAVKNLNEHSPEDAKLRALGKQHAQWGVQREHYTAFGKAVIQTWKQFLFEKLTTEAQRGWVLLLQNLMTFMITNNYASQHEEMIDPETPKGLMEGESVDSPLIPPAVEEAIAPSAEGSSPYPKEPLSPEIKKTKKVEIDKTQTNVEVYKQKRMSAQNQYKSFLDEEVNNMRGFTPLKIYFVRNSWTKVHKDPDLGLKIFNNLFRKDRSILDFFSFSNLENLEQSQVLKDHGVKVVRVFDSIIEHLEQFEYIVPNLERFGNDHVPFKVRAVHFEAFEKAFLQTLEDKLGGDFDEQTRDAWATIYNAISGTMIGLLRNPDGSEHQTIIQQESTMEYDQSSSRHMDADSMRMVLQQSSSRLLLDYRANTLRPKKTRKMDTESNNSRTNKIREHYHEVFRKEVDFHHKMAFRFEKCYKLGKSAEDRRYALNLEIIECISDHSGYVEQDPMTLFYCLFFCIFYHNEDIVEFLRILIQKLPPNKKIDKLLECIDIYGLKRLRTKGEPISSFVYHMVFYQAVDDELRIVYSSAFSKMKFIQLRDQDAVHFLNQRDYELIRASFDHYVTKLNLSGLFQKPQSLKSHSYRRYSQAFYEEIVINNEIESRVAQNFREKFLQKAEDIFVVFEMYCKEDYDEEFQSTPKEDITHKQFLDLFQICLKNDSYKIAILLYTLYLSVTDMDSKMIDILITSLRESTKYHEMKLFFLHEHFNQLSIFQMNQVLDIYSDVLHSKDPKMNPMVSQYNVIKIALLIYRICWKIEEKQIYSLITKCSALQSYITTALCTYFEKQSNILVLHRFMREPILHMTERKDSLDVMYQMNMAELLKHPVVVEVLNLVYEGKYSITASALSMSPTFQCALEMPMIGNKRITDKLLQNIQSFGADGMETQTQMMYNIWKISIQRRELDEMFFTVIMNILLVSTTVAIILVQNQSAILTKEVFEGHVDGRFAIIINMDDNRLHDFCAKECDNLLQERKLSMLYRWLLIFNTLGQTASVIQKLVTYKFKDNVTLQLKQVLAEGTVALYGIILFIRHQDLQLNTLMTDTCGSLLSFSEQEALEINQAFTMRHPVDGSVGIRGIISILDVGCILISILMLQRTQKLGDQIMMMMEMIQQMAKFIMTFGLIILTFYFVGKILIREIKVEATDDGVLLDLFDAINANQKFDKFSQHVGLFYIGSFMYIFRILLISLLAAMFINRYKYAWKNLDALRRFNIIQLKNSFCFDQHLGGVTMTFFPVNILMMPFILPILAFRNPRFSDFVLKLQYTVMIMMYVLLTMIFIIPMLPLLYIKTIINSIYVSSTHNREDYKHQTLFTILTAVFGGPIIGLLSMTVDLISAPAIVFKSNKDFEHKYQMQADRMNQKQTNIVHTVFKRIFTGKQQAQYSGRTISLHKLMEIHGRHFVLIENLHDFVCKGVKDYKESLKNVQSYNMSKILSAKCAIPDSNGDFKSAKCEMDIIRSVLKDVSLFNYVDVALRKYWMRTLLEEIKEKSKKKNVNELEESVSRLDIAQANKDNMNLDFDAKPQEEEEEEHDSIDKIELGPDGVPLWRNPLDMMNNFFINYSAIAFTDVQKKLIGGEANTIEIKRLKRYEFEIDQRKDIWKINTVGTYKKESDRQRDYIALQLRRFQRMNTPLLQEQITKLTPSQFLKPAMDTLSDDL